MSHGGKRAGAGRPQKPGGEKLIKIRGDEDQLSSAMELPPETRAARLAAPYLFLPVSGDVYADALLLLGIAAAYDVDTPPFSGGVCQLPLSAKPPMPFPTKAGEDIEPQPPKTFHRIKQSVINMLGGKAVVAALAENWNMFLPDYHSLMTIIQSPLPNWRKTDYHDAKNRWSTSATFRPTNIKGVNNRKAADGLGEKTLKEFWLLDALRAIGFLVYAQTYLLPRESSTARLLVFVPSIPMIDFHYRLLHQPDLECANRARLMVHAIGSGLNIPRVYGVRYGELNRMARSFLGYENIEPLVLSEAAIGGVKSFIYSLREFKIPEQSRLASLMLDSIENRNSAALAELQVSLSKKSSKTIAVGVVNEIMTADRICER